MHHSPLSEFLDKLRVAQERPRASVLLESDPALPGRTKCSISGQRREDVQAEINRFFDKTEEVGGLATFTNPYRTADGYAARGEIVQFEDAR